MDNQTQIEWKGCFQKGNQGARDKHLGATQDQERGCGLRPGSEAGLSHTRQPQGTAFVEFGGAGGEGSRGQLL